MITLKKFFVLIGLSTVLFSCESETENMVSPTNQTANSGNNDPNTSGSSANSSDESKNFSLTSDANLKVSLSDYKDNVVVLFFFGNGCTSCKAVSPDVQKTFVENYANKKVQVLGLDVWDGNLSSVRSFKTTSNLTFPLLLEASGVAKSFQTTYDRILVVDKKGVVRFKGTQLARNDIENAKKTVDEYLKK